MADDRVLLRFIVVPGEIRQLPSPTLLDWLQQDPTYRGTLKSESSIPLPGQLGAAEMVLAGVLTPATLLGLFELIKAWIELHRGKISVRVEVEGSAVDIEYTGRSDPERVISEVLKQAGQQKSGPNDPPNTQESRTS